MLPTRWYKVFRDLWLNKTRTLLVVMSITVGVFAVGAVTSAREILSRDLSTQYTRTSDLSAAIFASQLDENFIDSIAKIPEIADAQGRAVYLLRVKNIEPRANMILHGIQDFNDVRINRFFHITGPQVPPKRGILLERAAFELFKVKEGDLVTVDLPDGKQRELQIVGSVFDVNAPPPRFASFGTAFTTLETLEWLGFPKGYSQIRIRVREQVANREYIQQIVDKIKERVEDSGRIFFGSNVVQSPGQHYANEQIQAILLILTVLGGLSMFLSAFLVVNTISAILAQHTKQIGIMKAIGGRFHQISSMYLTMVLAFGLLSMLIAVPLGAAGAQGLTQYIAGLLNFDILTSGVPINVLLIEIAAGLIVPMLAALVPIFSGTRITVREAISSTGIDQGTMERVERKARRFMPHTPRLTFIPRPLVLSLRNTFRRKGRLMLTLGTLILASAIFISVFTVRDSLLRTLQDSLQYWSYDIEVILANSQAEDKALNQVRQVPGVMYAEAWSADTVRRVRPDREESRNFAIIAPPTDSPLIQPIIMAGRWLNADEPTGVVINGEVLADEPDLKVGDSLTLKFGARKFNWPIIGIAQSTLTGQVRNPRVIYMNQETYRHTLGIGRQVRTLVVVTEQHDGVFQAAVARDIEENFRRAQMRVDTFETITDRRSQIQFQFDLLITFLVIMAALLAVVGGLGLTGTMSINVLERTREIGVMRAIGASDGSIRQIVIVEGILIGLISWAIGALMAWPISRLLSDAVGEAFLRRALKFGFSFEGVVIWLGAILVIAALASFFPAWRASRLTVREVLAYE